MIVTILFWLLAWFIAGTPQVEPWNSWFVFLVACSVATFAAALAHTHTEVYVPVVPAEEDDDDEEE